MAKLKHTRDRSRPPPCRRVPRHNRSPGEGRRAPLRPVQARILERPPGQNRRLKGPWQVRVLWPGHGYLPPPPKKSVLGKSKSGGRSGGADTWGTGPGEAGTGSDLQGAGTGGRWRGAGTGVRIGAEYSGSSAASRSSGAGAGGLDWAANGGMLAVAVNKGVIFPMDGGLGRAADDGVLVLARARTLPRHRKIPSLQLSMVVSGTSTGRWELTPSQNSLLIINY